MPTTLAAMTWLASGPDLGPWAEVRESGAVDSDGTAVATLRERIMALYTVPFDAIFDSPQAREELVDVDRIGAIALLIGPLILGRLSTLADFDFRGCAEAAVDGFLATHARKAGGGVSAARTGSAGA